MKKLKLIIKREYLAKVRNKSFIVMTILSPLLIVGMIALIVFLTQANKTEKKEIAILDETGFFKEDFRDNETLDFKHLQHLSMQQAKDSARVSNYYGLLYIPQKPEIEEVMDEIQFFSKKSPGYSFLKSIESRIQGRVREIKLKAHGVSPQVLENIDHPFILSTSNFTGSENLKGINEIKGIVGGAFGYLIMMFIVIYGAFVMRSVIEEKTSRIVEVIVSSVKPFQLMLGKIIGSALAGITQFIIWIVSANILIFILFLIMGLDIASISNSPQNLPPEAIEAMNEAARSKVKMGLYAYEFVHSIPWGILITSFIIYFALGYLIYSSIYAAIGSAVDNETDTQQFMLPVIMPLVLAVYVGFFSVFENPHGPIAVGFSIFPLTSPIVMLMRLPSGIGPDAVPLWQLIVSILLLIICFLGIVWLAAKIYRVGILMYGKKAGYRELYKWLKY